jgi:hypothetical protein
MQAPIRLIAERPLLFSQWLFIRSYAMTEAEWLACTEPIQLLQFVHRRASNRKLRLLACACCRWLWPLLRDKRSRKVVKISEQFADGNATEGELDIAGHAAWQAANKSPPGELSVEALKLRQFTWQAVRVASLPGVLLRNSIDAVLLAVSEIGALEDLPFPACDIIRCIFGNIFYPSSPLPLAILAWHDGTVRQIAEVISEEQAFYNLPVLADALLDAGCDNEDLIQHCRSSGPHVQGCWALDLILGKS